jgi:hypothetical protein
MKFIGHGVADAFRRQTSRQPVVAVAVELQAERRPGRDPQADQPERGIQEVELVVQAFTAVRSHERLAGSLVVPRPVAVAGFHRREDVHRAGMLAALLEHPRDNRFLANMALGDVLDRDPCFRGKRCRTVSNTIPQLPRELWVIKDADPVGIQIPVIPSA